MPHDPLYGEDSVPSQVPGAPPAAPAQSAGRDVAGAWRSWLGDPSNRAALMQFGISLMQPMPVGQTSIGHVGTALGQAGETLDRRRAMDLKEAEAGSKMDLREAQAQRAEMGAAMAGQNLSHQEEMLALKRMLGVVERSSKLQQLWQEAKLLNPKLKLEDFLKENQQIIGIVAAQERGVRSGGAQGGNTPTVKPKVGDVVRGYRYKGGNLNDKNSWEPAQ